MGVSAVVLGERFEGTLEQTPIGPSADPRRLLRIEHAKHPGALSSEVLFELADATNLDLSSALRIKRIVFRRFYPDDLSQLP